MMRCVVLWRDVVWRGVACRGIDLSTNLLSGTLPQSLSVLSALESLVLHSNTIGGTIPDALSTLTRLTYVFTHVSLQGAVMDCSMTSVCCVSLPRSQGAAAGLELLPRLAVARRVCDGGAAGRRQRSLRQQLSGRSAQPEDDGVLMLAAVKSL
jgi:hypothetical protein